MSKSRKLDRSPEQLQNEQRIQELLKEHGLVQKPKEELMSPEAYIEKVKELLDILKMAKESKDEALGKKIRRKLRKLSPPFYISKMTEIRIQ